jgi:hypothetical protein
MQIALCGAVVVSGKGGFPCRGHRRLILRVGLQRTLEMFEGALWLTGGEKQPAGLGLRARVVRQVAGEDQQLGQCPSALLMVEQIANQLDAQRAACIALAGGPHAVDGVFVMAYRLIEGLVAGREAGELQAHLGIFWHRLPHSQQDLRGSAILPSRR